MPRQSRIDAPGALHHIMIRGIERNDIFKDNKDRDNYIERLGSIVKETSTSCYAWALLLKFNENYIRLLIRNQRRIPIGADRTYYYTFFRILPVSESAWFLICYL